MLQIIVLFPAVNGRAIVSNPYGILPMPKTEEPQPVLECSATGGTYRENRAAMILVHHAFCW